MGKKPLPSTELLRQLLDYDPLTGKLHWKERPLELFNGKTPLVRKRNCTNWNNRFAGKEAFIGISGAGYYQGSIFGHYMLAQRVIWAIYYGKWPKHEVGRHNGDNLDNRIWNLRDVEHGEILRNSRRSKLNTSGVTGVSWDSKTNKWQAGIRLGGKAKYLGKFVDFEEAVSARRAAEIDAGFHSRHGEERTTPRSFIPKSDRWTLSSK